MKIIWKEADVIAGNRFYFKDKTEIWQIGYYGSNLEDATIMQISTIDGMVTNGGGSLKDFAQWLTIKNAIPTEKYGRT